jgi:hypothetical protein
MKTKYLIRYLLGGFAMAGSLVCGANLARAHCDTLDGPVVKAARAALVETNVNLVLPWVKQKDEAEIKRAFEKTIAVRKLNFEARDLADMYFFETLVRVHRAGEGEPYTGLKPAGPDLGPATPAADKSIEDGKLEPVTKLLTEAAQDGLHKRFEEVVARKNYAKNDVHAGREYVKAYVEYVHYVEGVYDASIGPVAEHAPDRAQPATHDHK